MKFTAVLAFVAAATVVSASTNAERLARGMSPNAPGKRATPAFRARGSWPSNTPGQCNTGPVQCCNSVTDHKDARAQKVAGLLGIVLPVGGQVGLDCTPITAIGVGSGAKCSSQTVCCDHNQFNGLINVGCSPINAL